jgi:SAM-dependent methyltransferase
MLDYACGNGNFALSMRRLFPNSDVFATDYHTEAPPMLKESDVQYTDYTRLGDKGPFDFILCRHVLEHTYNPVEFLRRIGSLLRSEGVLMIEVPNLEAPFRRIFGRHWDLHYVPFHPIHFSKAALRKAVVDAGLTVENEGGAEMPKIGRSLRNWIGCKYNAALFVSGVLLHPLQIAAGVVSGEPTCLRLWSRKP